ncbi:MAG TPA: hypothetical protein VEI97_16885, partial [bacterium]|nr:hypothetical protein [bacterium]
VRDDGWSLAMEATTGGEILRLEAAGPAEEAEPEAAYFITHRLNGWTRLALWPLGNMPVRHPRMSPYTGTLTDVRIDRFRTLGLLTGEEEQRPFAVHFTPQVPFIGLPPVPLF